MTAPSRSPRAAALGSFLRARRESVSVTHDGQLRRTPGLRREEVADLAGVSVAYYTRLEQGHPHRPSPEVLGALARALNLDADERAHLNAIASTEDQPPAPATTLATPTRRLYEILPAHAPAYVINRLSDIIACNPIAAELFVDLTGMDRPNSARYAFCEPAARRLFVDWEEIASDSAAHLRAEVGHHPGDPNLTELVAQLSAASPDFKREWDRREVHPKHLGTKRLHHPRAGRLDLDYQVILIAAAPDQRIVAYALDADHPTRSALAGLTTSQT